MSKIKSLLENSIHDIIKNYSSFFLSKKNINGIALGNKIINNINIKEPTLHVLVEKKVPKNKLYKHDVIPKNFLGIKTDVIEIGTLSLDSANNTKDIPSFYSIPINNLTIKTLRSRMRPIQPGCAICHFKSGIGTLGCIVFDNNNDTPYILSNNHVLANLGANKKGTYIYQPTFLNFLKFKNNIAKLTAFVQLNTIQPTRDFTITNTMDAAIAKINSNVKYNKTIFTAGTIDSISEPIINEVVYKVGCTTGYTQGTIESIDATVLINSFSNQVYQYTGQIISSKISMPGDSGSLVFNKSKKAIGLIISGSKNSTTITPINIILDTFNVHL